MACSFSLQDAWTLPPPAVVPWPGASLEAGKVRASLLTYGLTNLSLCIAGPSSGAWLSSGRRSRRRRRKESTACIITALAGVTVVNAVPTSMTLRRWPCAPGALSSFPDSLGGLLQNLLPALPKSSYPMLQICPRHVQEDRWVLPFLSPCVQGKSEFGVVNRPALPDIPGCHPTCRQTALCSFSWS